MKKIVAVLGWLVLGVGVFFGVCWCGRNADSGRNAGGGFGYAETGVVTRVDTVWVRDTVRDVVLVPVERFVVRVDTVWLRPIDDTTREDPLEKNPPPAFRPASAFRPAFRLPVERAVYATDDYRAVVEGFRPSLVELELYRNNFRVTKELTRTPAAGRWSAGIQAGYGITPKGFAPYLGVGVQYRVSWR